MIKLNFVSVMQVYMYQATCRMIAGASPLQTRRLLQRSVMCQRSTSEQLPEGELCDMFEFCSEVYTLYLQAIFNIKV